MAQWANVPDAKFNNGIHRIRESTPPSCPLTSTLEPWHEPHPKQTVVTMTR